MFRLFMIVGGILWLLIFGLSPHIIWPILKFVGVIALGFMGLFLVGAILGQVSRMIFGVHNKDREREGTHDMASDKFAGRIADTIEEKLAELGADDVLLDLDRTFDDSKSEYHRFFQYRVEGNGFDACDAQTGKRYSVQIRLHRQTFGKAEVKLIMKHDARYGEPAQITHGSMEAIAERIAPQILKQQKPLLDRFGTEEAA